MGRHLNEQALLELAETGKRHPHADECATCAHRVREVREAIAIAREVEVPEPSPLFWDHLSARVHDAIARPRRAGAGVAGRSVAVMMRRVAYAGLAVAVISAAVWRIESPRRGQALAPVSSEVVARHPVAHGDPNVATAEPVSEDAWELVTDVASTVDLETATDAAALSLQPGTAERAALQLSPDERRELVRLLQAALEQPE